MLIETGDRVCIQNIQFLRKKYSMSRKSLAKLIGISEQKLRSLEEEPIPTVFTYQQLTRISQIFDLPMEEIINHPLS